MRQLDSLSALFKEKVVQQKYGEAPHELYDPVDYIMALGGKRLRPVLCLAGNTLFNGDAEKALMPALAIEVFHNYTLVHDDIMDEADLRRGQTTIHKKWDVNTAILSGDVMLIKAYQYLAQIDTTILPLVLDCFSKAAVDICEGQQWDMNFETAGEVLEKDYLNMIEGKTAVLLGAALKIGALTAKASVKDADALYQFGIWAGLAFQIQDDILDAFGDSEKVGKTSGGDILQDKKTLLMIKTQSAERQKFEELMHKNLEGREKVIAFKNLFLASGALDYCKAKRDKFLDQAFASLENAHVQNSALKQELIEYAQWLAHRDY